MATHEPSASASVTSSAHVSAPHEESFQARVAKLNKQVGKVEKFMLTLAREECPSCRDSRFCDAHRPGGSEECAIMPELRKKIDSLGEHNRQRSQNLTEAEKEVRSLIEALKVRSKARLERLKTLRDRKLDAKPGHYCSSCIVS